MNEQTFTHLKCISNGRVFLYTEVLAARDDMVPCDAQGQIASGHIGDAGDLGGPERRETPFLGNMANGVLYRYTDILAQRDDMISIDSQEQWDSMQKNGEAPQQAPNTIAPTLGRSSATKGPSNDQLAAAGEMLDNKELPESVSREAVNPGIALPDIEGLGAREAKTALSDWAEKNFGEKIDRRPALTVVVDACRALAASKVRKAG